MEPEPPRPTVGELFVYLWRLGRPEFWAVSAFPFYVGFLLATHELAPGLGIWTAFAHQAAMDGATGQEFYASLVAWLASAWRFILGALVMGPLLWMATILINDVHDVAGDRANPRKARSPLVQGLVDRAFAHAAAYGFAALSLAVAAFVGRAFLGLTFACLVLAWLYSVPPVRLKTVPGADVAVNAIGIGVVSGLAGWSIGAPLSEAPYGFIPQSLLVVVAIYVPTTLVDHDADRRVGYTTVATKIGRRNAFLLGWWSWVLANLGALVLAWQDWIIPRRMLPFLLVFVPVLLVEYYVLIGKAEGPAEMIRGILISTLTFLAVNLIFALMYTSWWV
ncbi:MAG: UbiA family prenyltransferase [Euryarchaeota archaeon]|nr:UbiA family prenyltransferase [Euryarchaeota archaeon]